MPRARLLAASWLCGRHVAVRACLASLARGVRRLRLVAIVFDPDEVDVRDYESLYTPANKQTNPLLTSGHVLDQRSCLS